MIAARGGAQQEISSHHLSFLLLSSSIFNFNVDFFKKLHQETLDQGITYWDDYLLKKTVAFKAFAR